MIYKGELMRTVTTLLAFILGIFVSISAMVWLQHMPTSEAEGLPQSNKIKSEDVQTFITDRRDPVVVAVEKVAPSVVAITTEVPTSNPFSWSGYDTSSSEGSGVVINKKGIVLTNAHVVDSAIRIRASFSDESSYVAEIIGISPELDLAVLQLKDGAGFPAVDIGSSTDLMLGEKVVAVGNPFGLGHTVTTGVISAVARPLETERRVYQDFIQTDASINPGNSGGPLVNIQGALVGINTAIRPDAEGIGFAIPVDRAMKVAEDILNFGKVQLPWLGVNLTDVIFRKEGRKFVAPQVSKVYGDGLLKFGDVILKIDDRKVQGRGDLNAYLSSLQPDGKVKLEVWREGETLQLEIETSVISDSIVQKSAAKVLGISLKDGKTGVIVTSLVPSGAFAQNRLRAGDQILAINGQPIQTKEEFYTLLSNAKNAHRGSAIFTIRRGNSQGQIEMPI
jgi:serine protease Do